jgi:hypothetical protein
MRTAATSKVVWARAQSSYLRGLEAAQWAALSAVSELPVSLNGHGRDWKLLLPRCAQVGITFPVSFISASRPSSFLCILKNLGLIKPHLRPVLLYVYSTYM